MTKEEKDKSFDDVHDIQRHVLDIHSQDMVKVLSQDLVMAVLDEKQKKFITKNIQSAHEALHLIKDKEYAEYASSRLLLSANTVAILERNKKDNPIIGVTLREPEREAEETDNKIDQKILDKLERKKDE